MVRGGLGAAARARRARSPACRRSSTGCGSRTSRTSISASRRAARARSSARSTWVEERQPDLVCVTGDLLSRPRGEPTLLALLERLAHPYVVLGNHDLAISRDPFSQPVALGELAHGTLLSRRVGELELRGRRVEIAGVDPRSWLDKRPSGLRPTRTPTLRILLCHFPRALDRVPAGRLDLILAGHLHARPDRAARTAAASCCSRIRARATRTGSTGAAATAMHVSPGLGTTFVPFRFSARPEATELVLRCGHAWTATAVISPDVLARYAADAAAEVRGVHTKQRRGARVDRRSRSRCTSSSTTARTSRPSRPRSSAASPTTSQQMADVRPDAVHVVVDDVQRRDGRCRRASPG